MAKVSGAGHKSYRISADRAWQTTDAFAEQMKKLDDEMRMNPLRALFLVLGLISPDKPEG